MKKVYTLMRIFDFEEGTIFITNFEKQSPLTTNVFVKGKALCCIYDDGEFGECNITKSWLNSTFILK